MPLNVAGLNQKLDALDETPAAPAAGIAFLALHSGVIGSGSAGELTGGSPAYARQPATWAAASAGSKALTGTYTWNIPPGATVTRLGYWSAVTAGTYFGDAELVDETFAGQGTYTLTAGSISVT